KLKEALAGLRSSMEEIQRDPLVKLQSFLANNQAQQPGQSTLGAQQAAQFIESHRIGNSILSHQDVPLVSIPIPLTLDGKSWVGYVHIYAEPDQKNLKKNFEEGNFALKFTVQTNHLGPVDASLRVQKNVVDGIFNMKGGDEKKFLEQNREILLKRLESLPFKVRSIEARTGGIREGES